MHVHPMRPTIGAPGPRFSFIWFSLCVYAMLPTVKSWFDVEIIQFEREIQYFSVN